MENDKWGSKESKSEKQAEGETELSWDHEGLEPYPGPEKPKSQRSPRESKTLEKEIDKSVSPKTCPKCKGKHDEKDCTKLPPKEVEKELPPPKDSREVPEGDKEDLGPKWNFQKGETVIDKDTKQWVDEQNKFWGEEKRRGEKEKQKENIPRKFEPKTPVKVLQRDKQPIITIPRQAPTRPRGDRYAQGQYYSWTNGYIEPEYRGGYGTGYSYRPGDSHENKNWGQGNGYGKKYGAGDKKRQGRAYGASGTQSHTYYTTHGTRRGGKYAPLRGIGGGQGGDDGNGSDKGNGDKKRYKSTKYDFGDMDEEESDTEDSFELEITPQQLS